MRTRLVAMVLAAGLCASAAQAAQAGTVTLGASADTYITEHPGLGGPTSVHGSDGVLYSISANQPPNGSDYFNSYPLIEFDLSGYAGRTVTSGGTMVLSVWQTLGVTQTYEVWAALALNESSTTYNNGLGGSALLSTQTVTATSGSTVSLSFSASVLQSWIDSPGANYGVLLYPTTYSGNIHSDIIYYSRESSTGLGPTLTFDVADVQSVPLPPAGWSGLGLLGALGAAAWRKRRATAFGI